MSATHSISTSRPAFRWDARKRKAAALVAEGSMSTAEVAAEVGVVYETVWGWQRNAAFAAKVEEGVAAFEQEIRRHAYANRHRRIEALCRRAEEIERVWLARAKQQPETDDPTIAAQLATRQIVKRAKYIGHGKYSERLFEYEADTALLRAWLEVLEQIARECGQWRETVQLSGPLGGPLAFVERTVRVAVRAEEEPTDARFRVVTAKPAGATTR